MKAYLYLATVFTVLFVALFCAAPILIFMVICQEARRA